jgi:Ser/Thr protein kinase RdoA (MazF antagonist)
MAFLRHLDACGVRVSVPVPSCTGAWVESLGDHTACVLTWAPGERVIPGSRLWDDDFVRAWGRNLGAIHAAARSYEGPPRWEWHEEGLVADADALLPQDDAAVRAEFSSVLAHIGALPSPPGSRGMNHGDYAPQNFNWEPVLGITSFDFGNCCSHAFVNDVVIASSVLWRLPERERWRDVLLSGYRETMDLDDTIWAERRWFLRLRILYVYLSRLHKFGPDPDPDARDVLRQIRAMIRPDPDWP